MACCVTASNLSRVSFSNKGIGATEKRNNCVTVMNMLLAKYSPAAVAALCGAIFGESGFDHTAVSDAGYKGIFQTKNNYILYSNGVLNSATVQCQRWLEVSGSARGNGGFMVKVKRGNKTVHSVSKSKTVPSNVVRRPGGVPCWFYGGEYEGVSLSTVLANASKKDLKWVVDGIVWTYFRPCAHETHSDRRYNTANIFADIINNVCHSNIKKITNTTPPWGNTKPWFGEDAATPSTPQTPSTPSTPAPRPTTPRIQTPTVKTTIIPTPSFTNGTSSVSSICEAIINHRHIDQQSIGQQTNATPTRQVITTITPDDPRSVLETFGDAQPTKPTTPKPTTSTAATTNNTNNDATQYTKIKMGKDTAWEVTNGKDGAVFLVGDSQMNTIANRITLGSTYFSYAISGDGFDVKDKIHNRVANGELPWFIEDKSSQSQSQAKAVDSKITVQSYGYNYSGTINAWGSSHWGEKKSHYVRLLGADGQVKQILKKYKPSKIICWCGHNTADANKKSGSVAVANKLYNHFTNLAKYIKSNSPRTKFYIFPIAEIHQYKWSNSTNPSDWFYNIANAKLRTVPNATFVEWPSAWGPMDNQVPSKDPHIQWKGQASGKAGSWLAMCT